MLVVVVTHNSYHTIEACLGSLAEALGADFAAATLVVDNASSDGTVARVRALFPAVEIVESGENLGFGAGVNRGIRRALEKEAEFVYLLNPDARVTPGFLAAAVAEMARDESIAGVQSLLLLEPDGALIDSAGNTIHFLGFGYCDQHRRSRSEAPAESTEIAFASGAAVLLRLSALARVGTMAEELFLYCEDMDLCWRLRLAGHAIRLAPSSVVLHRHEFSRNPDKYFLLERNRWLVLLRLLSGRSLLVLALPLVATEIALLGIAARGGWLRQKLRALGALTRRDTRAFVARSRREIQGQRRRGDRELLRPFTSRMELDGGTPWLVERVANPVLGRLWRILAGWL